MNLQSEQAKAERIMALARELRRIARPAGTMHGLWDSIFDMESFVKGEPTIIKMTAEEWIKYAEDEIQKHSK